MYLTRRGDEISKKRDLTHSSHSAGRKKTLKTIFRFAIFPRVFYAFARVTRSHWHSRDPALLNKFNFDGLHKSTRTITVNCRKAAERNLARSSRLVKESQHIRGGRHSSASFRSLELARLANARHLELICTNLRV